MSESFRNPVLFADDTITYEKHGWEPPPMISGWTRSGESAWTLVPLFKPCFHRIVRRAGNKPCGAINITLECEKMGRTIAGRRCIDCTLREGSD